LLSRDAGYEGGLLEWHERAGIGVAVACAVLLGLHALNQSRAYRVGLILTCGLLVVTSHLGGSLTHGRDYLTRYAPEPLRAWLGGARVAHPVAATPTLEGEASQGVFAATVQPILRQYCVSCHGPDKVKAGLRLDSFEHLQRGNEEGPVIRAGDSAGSPLVHFMTLPLDDDSHMPPAGKPQPSTDDLTLLRWWIDSGASPTASARELKPSTELERVLKARRPGGGGDR
jgi:mono/diheme cytochrome c family protein